MRTVRFPGVVAVAALLALAAGCSSTVSGAPAPTGGLPAEATALVSAENEARGAPSANAVDACSLLDAAAVEALTGKNRGPEPVPYGGDGGSCTWENPDSYYSVTVDIGRSGSAANGTLPPQDPILGPERPLPDGMRSLGGGAVEFVAGDRLCDIQVATNGQGDSDERKAIELARVVRDRL